MRLSSPSLLVPFFLALSFLTRLPSLPFQLDDQQDRANKQWGQSILYYPLIGLIIGIFLCLPLVLLAQTAPMILASLIIIIWACITGGLHLDGLADSADAWLGGQGNPDTIHRILKDPLMGAAGVIAIVSILLTQFAALSTLISQNHYWPILVAPILGRSMALLLVTSTPYMRQDGLGSVLTQHLNKPYTLGLSIVIILGLSLFSLSGVITSLLIFVFIRRLMLHYIKGCTGDTIGAIIVLTETGWLLGVNISW